jgi:Zn-dependent oligopeptidase
MADDCDFFECDNCKKRLKEPVILKDGKRICKSHLEPGINDYIKDSKLHNYLSTSENVENTINNIKKLCQEYQTKREHCLKQLKALEENLNNKKILFEKIYYMNWRQELKESNQESSKLIENKMNIINANVVDLEKINKDISDYTSQLNLVSAINKLNKIHEEVMDLYNQINEK